ncbi:peroxisomal coenzyme A diphosphatase NUDT7 isoform X2 [Colius striatus]|uniref:peroxisomal coenzyme A diphosphatase NUDT7 isoform X2 n=1 Tax=Colius striatus TaxID=57412 RepID=UPI002B1DD7B7|nr:peroxisomal coenzyme A diphosphatase NUDT7 isoform X2 [Colius striatus]XP_061863478.1 peroxisomal coenzyme A diphosphatase NUDT7 isoform X2 [Colius striatus]XP_061863479.1 peroxisomal coenzyme A diphosphatase NUDT7 isoform X2 [Colius striatus]
MLETNSPSCRCPKRLSCCRCWCGRGSCTCCSLSGPCRRAPISCLYSEIICLYVFLLLKNGKLRRSPGEVCFPGGKSEETDKDEIDTALREAKEEVGLQPEKVEVICRLVPGIDKMNHLVTPVVGFIEDTFQATPNPAEVSHVFVVPLEYFVKPLHYKALPFKTSSGYLSRMHCFTYNNREHQMSFRIWGLTAHFAVFLALVIFGKRPTFEVDYDLDNLVSSSENNFLNLYASMYEKKKSNL